MTVTRTALDKCREKDCPFTRDEHDEWMERCANGREHGHRHDQPTHVHFPKKGMGGNNPNSKIVAIACWPLHDATDNGLNGMGIVNGEVRFWDIHNRTVVRGPAVTGEGEASEFQAASAVTEQPPESVVLSEAGVPLPSPAGASAFTSRPEQDAGRDSREFLVSLSSHRAGTPPSVSLKEQA